MYTAAYNYLINSVKLLKPHSVPSHEVDSKKWWNYKGRIRAERMENGFYQKTLHACMTFSKQ